MRAVAVCLLAGCCLAFYGCGQDKAESKPKAPQPTVVDAIPEDLGDPTAPVQIRALQGAKEARKQIEERRKEMQPASDAATQ